MTSRDWCFTSYDLDAMGVLKDSISEKKEIKYLVAQNEVCPTTERVHVQGYVQLTKAMRMAGVKKVLGDAAAHLEKRKGTHAEVRHFRAEPLHFRAEPMLCPCCPHFLNPFFS